MKRVRKYNILQNNILREKLLCFKYFIYVHKANKFDDRILNLPLKNLLIVQYI